MTAFTRSPANPILQPSEPWWESRAVLNPGAIAIGDRIALLYRAVGADGISRFGLAWSDDGERIDERSDLPVFEGGLDDPLARLGIEDPRIVQLDGKYFVTYCKASVERASEPQLSWEPAPFRLRSAIASGDDLASLSEFSIVLPERNTKDMVLFPERISGRYAALIREYPSIYYITSPDLLEWSEPQLVMKPKAGTWQAERIGPGPPPIRTDRGWLLLYHANEYLVLPENRRRYRMGLALLDLECPDRVIYRHPDPILEPEAPYEMAGPVGNVVFGTGIIERGDRFLLYYGAGDGVIGLATAAKEDLYDFIKA